MDEEGAVDDNLSQNNEEQIKQKKKSAKSVVNVDTVDTMKAAESSGICENEGISEVKRDHKGGKEKKTKRRKGAEDAEADVNGEASSGLTMDNAERKRERREKKKDKDEKFETRDTDQVKSDKSTDWQDGESVSGKESGEEVMEEEKKKKKKKKKKQKVKRNDCKVGEKDGEVIRGHSENCKVNATKIREETKGKKKRKDDSFVRSKDTHNDSKRDEVGLSSKRHDVEDHTQYDGDTKTNHERKKKKKHKRKEKYKDDLPAAQQEYVDSDTSSLLNTKEMSNNETELTQKKKTKFLENGSNDERDNKAEYAKKGKKRKTSLVVKGSDDASPNKSNKKVRFSGKDEAFPPSPKSNTGEGNGKQGNLVMGKRFTLNEDEIVKDAVMKYIEEHELGDQGLEMVLNSSKHRELEGCWKEIGSAISYRPYRSVYWRARIILMRSESRKWTQEEYDKVLKYQAVHGNKWRALADELGKHTWHVKDTWRRIKLPNKKKGNWSQEEYQSLFDLVNTDLQSKLSEDKRSKHGMLRDNICWSAISDELSTRINTSCCTKWYRQLTSPMVTQGVWADSDDYRLLSALYSLDATCLEDVEWDDLVGNRAGDVCRKRWNQMVLHLGHNGNKSFAEQVEVLAQRYCPHLLEARETWDSKPRVP